MQILFVILLFACSQLQAEKLLLLIIDSDNDPIYAKLRHIWSLYMHSDPEHVEAYFIRADPNISAPYLIDGDTIYLQTDPSMIPGVITKTVMALEALSPRHGTEFNFVFQSRSLLFLYF